MSKDDSLWYKDAVVYELHVKAFFDSTNDGIGDFAGLVKKLDYLQDLGVTAVWLLPFYPSPLRDDGYDIADYRNVNPAYGKLSDFKRFVREAQRRDLRVITELVINHTSDQHPWFQRARKAKPGSAWRDYYVWSDSDQKYAGTRIIFTDTETSNWAWDPVAKAYYWHRFFSHQPDLNFDNPQVLQAVLGTIQFWFNMGVDGLRLDAVPYLCEREGTNNENLPETHDVIKRIRAAVDARYRDRMLLAEANQWPEDVRPYFGDGDECHMTFHFPLMPRIYMALAQEDRHPITDILRQTPDIPGNCQWAIFLRNHDELTLEMVADRERDYLWNFYAADPRAKLNLGIRRRLAPLLDNDRDKIELLNGLLMSLPGTPMIYYGDEIGMGDNIYLGDRDGVRTPMQWSPDRNGGFSKADPARLYLPPIMDPVYGFEAVNVEAQSRSSSSLLNWIRRLIAVRKGHAAFGRGTLSLLFPGNRKVIAYLRRDGKETILCIANLSRAPQPVELDLSQFNGRVPVELIGRSPFPPIGTLPYFITLPGYGFYWFLLAEEAEAPSWHESFVQPLPELLTLVLPQGWTGSLPPAARKTVASQILPEFLPNQRWYAGKGAKIGAVELEALAALPGGEGGWLLSVCRVRLAEGREEAYFLPLSVAWDRGLEDPLIALLPHTLARVRQGARIGVLYDALADEAFLRTMIELLRANEEVKVGSGRRIAFTSTEGLGSLGGIEEMPVRRVGSEQSNTSVFIGDQMILKIYRRLQRGIHPEPEVGRYLTEAAGYANTPPYLGAIELVDEKDRPAALAVLQGFVRNQGDGWTYTLEYLSRFLEEAGLTRFEDEEKSAERHGGYLALIRVLGVRTAELHRALARPSRNPAFRPEPIRAQERAAWVRQASSQARRALTALRRVRRTVAAPLKADIDGLLGRRQEILERIRALVPVEIDAVKTRYHGDFHLGQVIVVQDDFHIIDFEGEPERPLAERRAKHTPLKDVAGMLRSFDYAGWAALLDEVAAGTSGKAALAPWVEDWERRACRAFLEGYREAIEDCPSYPKAPGAAENLLDLFMLEKAFYEIAYEAANRPDWLSIPVQGVLRLLESKC